MNEAKDIPVLLKGPLVREFLAGRKTVTRRLDLAKWRRAKPGDRIWFRETWLTSRNGDPKKPSELKPFDWPIWYAADDLCGLSDPGKTRVSIFMPKWAARCWAVIEDIREERLQDITEEDAIAEGVEAHDEDGVAYYGPLNQGHCDPRQAFRELWDSINTKPGQRWADKPTVARIQFRRIEVPS
jgi:hypothetical protein